MKIVEITGEDFSTARKYMREWVPNSDNAEMMCAALREDTSLAVRALVDNRGIAAVASYIAYKDRFHIFSLGSIEAGCGSLLMDNLEHMASVFKLPVTVLATKKAVGFYEKRGYKPMARQGTSKSVVRMRLPRKRP
jgi:hypothetical protein